MRIVSLIFVFVLLIGGSFRQAAAQTDQIYVRGGSSITGKIIASTPAEIAIDVRGNQRKVKVNEIRRVVFAEDPPELNSGRGKALAGKIESAWNDLKRVDPAGIQREVVKQDLQFFLALCEGKMALTAGGDKAKASQSMLAFVRKVPKSYHFYTAAELLGDLAVAQGDYQNAVTYYGAIAKSPFPEYKMRAMISQARALVGQGEFAKAETVFEGVLSNPSDTVEAKRQKLFAQVGKGRCLAETSSPEEGISLIEKVIADNDPSDGELFGRAYNAQGDCLLKAGKPKDALIAYLHVDVLFYSHPDIHAESLYHLSKLWAAAKKADRASAAKNLLNDRYSGSIWANKE